MNIVDCLNGNNINKLTSAKYNTIQKDDNQFYWVVDTGEIYKGKDLFTKVRVEFPSTIVKSKAVWRWLERRPFFMDTKIKYLIQGYPYSKGFMRRKTTKYFIVALIYACAYRIKYGGVSIATTYEF